MKLPGFEPRLSTLGVKKATHIFCLIKETQQNLFKPKNAGIRNSKQLFLKHKK